MTTWAHNLIRFYTIEEPLPKLPKGIQWLYPQQSADVKIITEQFFRKYYNDTNPRTLILGINPGRFGAGITGVNFTGPKQLTEFCHIEHPFKGRSELSAEFIYDMIFEYGSVEKFYADFFIGSVCPLGFVQNGKNINYYDDKQLLTIVEPFIIEKLSQLLSFNVNRYTCICIGGAKNYHYLNTLNASKAWFKEIIALPHPRFIMQYKRRHKQEYIDQYLQALYSAAEEK